jgi:hypothetical protein
MFLGIFPWLITRQVSGSTISFWTFTFHGTFPEHVLMDSDAPIARNSDAPIARNSDAPIARNSNSHMEF